jgi:hypothetical protein
MQCPIVKPESECPCPEYSKEGLCDWPYRNDLDPQLVTLIERLKGGYGGG